MFNLYKIIIVISICLLQITEVAARGGSVSVRGYYRSNGTYVAPHMRSAPDGNLYNNWSTSGNVNPYTGKEGTKTEPGTGSISPIRTLPTVYPPLIEDQQEQKIETTDQATTHEKTDREPVAKPTTPTSNSSNAIQIPQNSKIDYTGHNWECKSGFYQNGNSCEVLQLPLNAKVDYTGHSWECKPGFIQSGKECLQLTMPENSKIDYTGHNWECRAGYVQVANECRLLTMPENSKVDYTGHNWECKSGYRQVANICLIVVLPANAKIDYTGHSWECKFGFRQNANNCEPVQMPENAKIDYTGHSWECKYGFRQIGNECLSLNGSN